MMEYVEVCGSDSVTSSSVSPRSRAEATGIPRPPRTPQDASFTRLADRRIRTFRHHRAAMTSLRLGRLTGSRGPAAATRPMIRAMSSTLIDVTTGTYRTPTGVRTRSLARLVRICRCRGSIVNNMTKRLPQRLGPSPWSVLVGPSETGAACNGQSSYKDLRPRHRGGVAELETTHDVHGALDRTASTTNPSPDTMLPISAPPVVDGLTPFGITMRICFRILFEKVLDKSGG